MPDAQQEIETLMERVCGGSEDAVRELLDRYGAALLRVVRRRLSRRLRSQFDSGDFTQAVWASFFAAPLHTYQFESPNALLAFLTNLAANKVCDVARAQMQAKKRDVNRVQSLDQSTAGGPAAVAGPEPTPSQVVLAKEQWDRLLESQPRHGQQILRLLRDGHTHQEIATQLHLNEKTVRRVIRRALDQLLPWGLP